MTDAKGISDNALSNFRNGYNCSESVLLAIAKNAYMIESDLIPKIATGFGGGIAKQGRECGAVTAAVMSLGLKYGRSSPEELRAKTYNPVIEFYQQFTQNFGSTVCKELCGCDLSTPEGREKFEKENVHELKCSKLVSGAVEILMNLQEENV